MRTYISTTQDENVQNVFTSSNTATVGLHFTSTDLMPRIYADASHNIHDDGRGQGGIVITLGSAPIFC
jgi:hypothetical protein